MEDMFKIRVPCSHEITGKCRNMYEPESWFSSLSHKVMPYIHMKVGIVIENTFLLIHIQNKNYPL